MCSVWGGGSTYVFEMKDRVHAVRRVVEVNIIEVVRTLGRLKSWDVVW
jgi:hypothetical protein